MTPKQKLKSIEKKMDRIQNSVPEIDFKITSRYIGQIQRYYELRQEHFFIQFEIEHCETCGKKL